MSEDDVVVPCDEGVLDDLVHCSNMWWSVRSSITSTDADSIGCVGSREKADVQQAADR